MISKINRLNYLTTIISVILAIFIFEFGLRLFIDNPIIHIPENEPVIFEYDPNLGWKGKKGQYIFPPYSLSGKETQLSILEDGARITSITQNSVRNTLPKIVFCGGSFVQGWGVDDCETWAWKVQEKLENFEVLNYGTSGYGTYQSLLMLERNLPLLNKTKVVFYGFIDHHELRNIAGTIWIKILNRSSKRKQVYVPYATIDKDSVLKRNSPEKYDNFPFHKHSRVIQLLEDVRDKFAGDDRIYNKRVVTEKVILEMNKLCESNGVTFVFVILSASKEVKDHYIKYSDNNHIKVIDANVELSEDMIVEGDGHPNEKVHLEWANIFLKEFKKIEID
ncbi:hypothetical protein [Aquimarina sp. MMG016]|uniref:SGNH/GDSL hydrolase family protein n=1 Tax=Aquimarina sp. MMG016 TaxID=2822690 RepID=UPI001B39EA87|nr:hypothetical protein [Aquimarina sp. MMG016]MBQ4821782.1 hypothetical protein [Aquimarina sp. MMG016]